jgi:phosphatidylglycerophosphate synthase
LREAPVKEIVCAVRNALVAPAITLPNLLTASRLVTVPLLFVAAVRGSVIWFAALFFWACLSDVLDGRAARWLQQASPLGSLLDSTADAAFYLTAPFAAAILYPWLLQREWVTLALIIASYTLPVLYGFLKYRRLTAYHTIGARLSGSLICIAFFAMIAFTVVWPLRLATAVLVLSQLEEVAITTVLPRWRANVSSLRHALRLRAAPNVTAAASLPPVSRSA